MSNKINIPHLIEKLTGKTLEEKVVIITQCFSEIDEIEIWNPNPFIDEYMYAYSIAAFKLHKQFIDETDLCLIQIETLKKIIENYVKKDRPTIYEKRRLPKIKYMAEYFSTKLKELNQDNDFSKVSTENERKTTATIMGDKFADLMINFDKLKREFDKLETYEDRLLWWEQNEIYQTICLHTFGKGNETITIYPQTYEETYDFNLMAFRIYAKKYPLISFEGKKNEFHLKLKQADIPKKYIENQIEIIEKKLAKQKDKRFPVLKQFYDGYQMKMNVTLDDFLKSFFPYGMSHDLEYIDLIEGVNAASFHGFLLNQLTELEAKGSNNGIRKSKLDFTKEALRPKIIQLATLDGYESPIPYLNELLEDVKRFEDFEFTQDFFLKVHYLCKENAQLFWSQSHKNELIHWLKSESSIISKSNIFEKTFTVIPQSSNNNEVNLNPGRKVGYSWLSKTDGELEVLFNLLKGKFIDEVTELPQFKTFFTGQSIELAKPIKWVANKTLLAYFIDSAFSKNKFHLKTDIWATAKVCFESGDNLLQAKNNYIGNKNSNGLPKNYELIDGIFDTLENPL